MVLYYYPLAFNADLRAPRYIFAHHMRPFKVLALLGFIAFPFIGHAQETTTSPYSKPSRDYFMAQVGYDVLLNLPDSVNMGGLSRSANVYLCYDFPLKNRNMSFAIGAGIGSSNYFFKNQKVVISDTSTQILFQESFDTATNRRKFKYSTTYLEAPIELRYFSNKNNRNKGFKAAIGMKAGALINTHTKDKYLYNNKPIISKVDTRRYIESLRMSGTVRIGWGNFSIYGQYALNNFFRAGNGPAGVVPASIGICLSGL